MLADLLTAVRLLTVVPLGRVEGGRALRFFPLVGWMYGGLWLGIAWVAREAGLADGLGALLAGTIAVVASGMLSGLMHWDGLADCADGMGVRGDAARRLEVMRSSTIGASCAHSVSPVVTSFRPTAAAMSPARTSLISSRLLACICRMRPTRSFFDLTGL